MDAVSPRQHRRARIDPDFFGLRFDAKDAVDEVEQFVVALPRMCLDRPTSVVVARRPSLLPSTSFSLRFGFSKNKTGKLGTASGVRWGEGTTGRRRGREVGGKRVRGDAADGDEDDEESARGEERVTSVSVKMATLSSTGGIARQRPPGVLLEPEKREQERARAALDRIGGSARTDGNGAWATNMSAGTVCKAIGVFACVIALVGAGIYATTQLEIDLYEDIMPHVKNPVKFFLFNVVVVTFGVIPGASSATCVTAGILFGTLGGLALCVTSASVGGITSFILSRYVARPWVERLLVRDGGRFKALDDAVVKDGSQIVLLVRLSPFSPFTVASYLLGLTSVPFTSFAVATLVGLLPSSFVYVYMGDTGRRASGSGGATALEIVFYVFGLLMTLFVSYRIAMIAQDTMKNKVGMDWDPSSNGEENVELDVFGSRIDEEEGLVSNSDVEEAGVASRRPEDLSREVL
jgi:uncharacterized membrane protein YdjX (TVP38/TMEM64 family)